MPLGLILCRWPMIVMRTPKGWTGPKTLGGKPMEGTTRAHQLPIKKPPTSEDTEEFAVLRDWYAFQRKPPHAFGC